MVEIDFNDFDSAHKHVDLLIDILVDEKNYYEVNYFPVTNFDNRPCLRLYKSEAKYFCRDLKSNGFSCEIVPLKERKSLCFVYVFREGVLVNPLSLIDLYKEFMVIR